MPASTACSARRPESEAATLSAGLHQLRGGVLVALESGADIQPVRRLPWTVQERVSALAVLGDRVYAGVNGRGIAELGLRAGESPEVRYLYDPLLFAHRTLTTLIPGDADLMIHLYFNATLNLIAADDLPLRGVSLLRLAPERGEFRLVTPPFQAVRPAWEAVGFVAQRPERLFFEWKWSDAEEVRFAHTVLSLLPGGPVEERTDAMTYRGAYGFRDLEREAPPALRQLAREARRRLDIRQDGQGSKTSTAYHVELRPGGAPLPERYEYHPPGFARAENIRIHSLSAVQRGERYALLLPDGLVLRSSPQGQTAEIRLPVLPVGCRYGTLLLAGEHLVATWEQPAFTEVGPAGIFVRSVPDFP